MTDEVISDGESLTAVIVHRLVQAVLRERLRERGGEAERNAVTATLLRMNDGFQFDRTRLETWTRCRERVSHARSAVGYAADDIGESEALSRLLNDLGLYLDNRADYAGARSAYERALRIGEVAFGPDDPQVATFSNNLGSVLQSLGDYAGARTAFERALQIDEAAFGPDHPDVAILVNNLGGVLESLGDYAGTRSAYERALRIDEAAFGPDHPTIATRANELGRVLLIQGDAAEAIPLLERALRIHERFLGTAHWTTWNGMIGLAMARHATGDEAGAAELMSRSFQALIEIHRREGAEDPAASAMAVMVRLGTGGS